MSTYDTEIEADERIETHDRPSDQDNVIAFPARVRDNCRSVHDPAFIDMQRFPVDIRGQVTFGRLMSGLATVGLTVRIDTRSGRVVITDDAWEE